jgi:beta-glucanase (GH16 family)
VPNSNHRRPTCSRPSRASLAFLVAASFVGAGAAAGACSGQPGATGGDNAANPSSPSSSGGSGTGSPSTSSSGGGGASGAAPPSQGGPSTGGAPSGPTPEAGDAAAPSSTLAGWTLTWSDEFDGPDGSPVDNTKWNQETGNAGYGNNQELEYYTPGTANAVVTGGSLVITATDQGASAFKCEYGTCKYTSARINTQGKFQQAYGRFEARIQIPSGPGLWPAFWTLGDNIGSAGWPTCGEIDIMENIGKEPATNHGSLHGPGYSGGHALTGQVSIDAGALSDDFHVYDIEWAPDVVNFYLDGLLYETKTSANVPSGDKWVYDHPFFVILNVAVGGNFGGDPNASTTFPQTMKIDYVRVYTSDAADAGE